MQICSHLNRIFFYLILILSILLVSCNGADEPDMSNGDYVSLSLTPSFGDIESKSRSGAVLIDSNFRDGKIYTFGLWLCKISDNETDRNYMPISDDMFNFKGEYAPVSGIEAYDSWRFIFDNFNHKHIGFRRGSKLNVYACYPYIEGMHDPEHVPFSIDSQVDVLWCDPILLTDTDNNVTNINEVLRCHHLYTCIEIVVSLNNSANITLSSVTLTDKEAKLIISGTYNSTNGEIAAPERYHGSFTLSGLGMEFKPDEYIDKSLYILIPPVQDYYDGRFTLDFTIDGVKRSFAMPQIQNITAFEASTKYIYKLNVDNVMTFTSSGVDTKWNTIRVDDIEI